MEKKIRFSEQPLTSKIIYGVVIAILIFSAIIVGIVAANNRKTQNPPEEPPITNGEGNGTENEGNQGETQEPPIEENKPKDPLTFTMPMQGEIVTSHSLTVPVFSETLGEWRVHTGIDIACEEGAEVFCAADGKVARIYNDPLHGMTVEVVHEGDLTSVYSNLDEQVANGLAVDQQIKAGDRIGVVGDTSLVELGKEPHLHFVIRLKGVAVNPMDYFEGEGEGTDAA